MAIAGQTTLSSHLFRQTKEMNSSLSVANVNSNLVNHPLASEYVNTLLQEGECLAWTGDWSALDRLFDERQLILNDMSERWIEMNPYIIVKHMEQKKSALNAVQKREKESVKLDSVQLDLSARFSNLELDDVESSCTPTTERPSSKTL